MNYIPTSDAAFNLWITNFSSMLTDDPSAVGESGPVALSLQNEADEWSAAFNVASNPDTRTAPAVAAKDSARYQVEQSARIIAIRIRNNQAVTDEQRLAFGVTVPKSVPTPIPAPSSFPILGLRRATPNVHSLQYSDSDNPDGKAKPFGVVGLEIWRAVGSVAAVDPDQARYYAQATKSPFRSTFEAGDKGKICTYFARWTTRSGPNGIAQVGQWSAPLDVHVI